MKKSPHYGLSYFKVSWIAFLDAITYKFAKYSVIWAVPKNTIFWFSCSMIVFVLLQKLYLYKNYTPVDMIGSSYLVILGALIFSLYDIASGMCIVITSCLSITIYLAIFIESNFSGVKKFLHLILYGIFHNLGQIASFFIFHYINPTSNYIVIFLFINLIAFLLWTQSITLSSNLWYIAFYMILISFFAVSLWLNKTAWIVSALILEIIYLTLKLLSENPDKKYKLFSLLEIINSIIASVSLASLDTTDASILATKNFSVSLFNKPVHLAFLGDISSLINITLLIVTLLFLSRFKLPSKTTLSYFNVLALMCTCLARYFVLKDFIMLGLILLHICVSYIYMFNRVFKAYMFQKKSFRYATVLFSNVSTLGIISLNVLNNAIVHGGYVNLIQNIYLLTAFLCVTYLLLIVYYSLYPAA